MRRVVSGRTADGDWGVLSDSTAAATSVPVQGQEFETTYMWVANQLDLDTTDRVSLGDITEIFSVVPGSTRFLIESMAPTPEPTGWHRTNTVDLEYIISGEIDLIMSDGSSVTLQTGDVNVQLGGMHQWWNHSGAPCVFLIVMIGVESDHEPGLGEG